MDKKTSANDRYNKNRFAVAETIPLNERIRWNGFGVSYYPKFKTASRILDGFKTKKEAIEFGKKMSKSTPSTFDFWVGVKKPKLEGMFIGGHFLSKDFIQAHIVQWFAYKED